MKNIICFFIILLPLLVWGKNIEVKRVGLRQGLSNNFIEGITQDSRGFLWFATEEGLSKLEGNKFKVFLKDDEHPEKSINANELNCVYADRNDPLIWVGTQREGLCSYNYLTDEFTSYRNDPGNPNSLITNDITSIIQAQDGNLWLSTYHRGIEYFDKKSGQFSHYNSQTVEGMPDNIWTIINGLNGELYIGHCSQGFSILSPHNKRIRNFRHKEDDKHSLPGNEVVSLFMDSNDNLWIGTDMGLALYNPEADNFINFKDIPGVPASVCSRYIYGITQLGDNLWFGTENDGAYYFNIKQRAFMSSAPLVFNHLSHGDGSDQLSDSNVRCIYSDSYNNLWLGTWGAGINFISYNKPLFNVWAYAPNQQIYNCLNARTVGGICADSSDGIWVGTEGGGVNYFNKEKRVSIFSKESGDLQDDRVLSTFKDSQGTLWVGLYQGALHYKTQKDKKFHVFHLEEGSALDIRTIYEDHQKQLWIGSHAGVYVIDLVTHTQLKYYNTDNVKLPEPYIRALCQDKKQRMWIGTFGRGIAIFSSDMELLESLNNWTGFCSNRIEHIFRDSDNRMWVATSAGAVLFETDDLSKCKIFGRKNGLANNHIQAITEDNNGNIWLSTNSSISTISKDLKKISNYSYADGTPLAEFISGSVTKDSQGNIYFGSNDGVCYFDPSYVTQEYPVPSVIFTGLKIENNLSMEHTEFPLFNGEKIYISYQQNTFSISFNIQDYSLNGRVEYAYRLKGMNDMWYTLGSEDKVTFRNLPHGDYELQVRARLHNQEWASEVSTLLFTVYPPFWKSGWAILFYILLLSGIVVYQFRSYKRKMEWESNYKIEKQSRAKEQQINDERLRFFTNITHELRTPLTLILGPLEDLKKDTALSKPHAQKVSIIYQSAVRLLKLINQILEFRKTETQNKKLLISKANLSVVVYEVALKYQELNQNPAINFQIDIKEKDLFLYFDKEVITMILDNLLSNAIKYTPEGVITLSLEKESDEYTAIRITDTGYGISEDAIPHVFERYYQEGSDYQASGTGIGLSLVKNLVELHGGDIRVESTLGEGSCFILTLPTHYTYPGVPHTQEETEIKAVENADELVRNETSKTENKQVLLVVEDNIDIRNYIASSFSEEFKVIIAENGEIGMEKAFQDTPDIIVSDIMMPVKNGIELCRTLKQDIRTSHIPVILLTVKDTLEDKEEGYEVGADSYLTKPFSASLLHSRIRNLLELRSKLANKIGSVNWSDKKEQVIESLNQIDNEFIEKVTALIEEDISSDKIDTNYIADHLCMSISTLYRKMKALTNLSTNEFIRKVKMKNAERMLLEQKYTISEISYKVGINTVSYFRQCFLKEYGLSPTQYLKKVKGVTIKDEEE